MSMLLLGLGLVLSVEGLVFALAPARFEQVLEAMARLAPETRRLMGLGALAAGVTLVWLAKSMGL